MNEKNELVLSKINSKSYKINVKSGLLQNVLYRPSPNKGMWRGGKARLYTITPIFIVVHYTASEKNSVDWLCDHRSKSSAHLVVTRQGEVTQLIPFNMRAWHCGRSNYDMIPDINSHSIGIELENWGELKYKNPAEILTWTCKNLANGPIKKAKHPNENEEKYWEEYTPEQLATCFSLIYTLGQYYKTIKIVLGHSDIAPRRKLDPGPLFPMKQANKALKLGKQNPIR